MAKKDAADGEEPQGGKKKLGIILVVVALVAAGGMYFFMSKKNAPEPPPKPGKVIKLDPLHVNLADGHFLKISLALQAIEGGHGDPDGSKALDEAVSYLSLRPLADMNTPATRAHLKENLIKRIEKRYDHEVMDVYVTEFVTQ